MQKKLFLIFCVLLIAVTSFAAIGGIGFQRGTGVGVNNGIGFISPGLGPELYGVANALSKSNETNATTGTGNYFTTTYQSQSTDTIEGTYAVEIVSDGTAGSRCFDDIQDACTLVNGTKYKLSFWVKHSGAGSDGGEWTIAIGSSNSAMTYPIVTIDNTDTTWQRYSYTFTHTTDDTRNFVVRENSPENDGGVFIDGLSVREK